MWIIEKTIPMTRHKMSGRLIEIPDIRKHVDDPESQTEQAFNLIEEMIVTLEIPPGGSVSEATLSARTGIGRTPIRMALRRLEHMGLVTSLPRKGVFIRQMKVEDQLAILEVRRPVEKMLAMKAARLATTAQRALLRISVNAMLQSAEAGDLHRYLHHDQACDQIIYETSRNMFAIDFVTLLYSHSRRFWVANSQATNWVKVAQLHWAMMNAIADGDVDKTATSSDDLIDYLETTCRSILGV
jgi:DNA-binding GntR family transcriptional regulator